MKSKTLILAIVCVFSTLAYSQKPNNTATAEQRATKMTAKMKTDLDLSASQETQVKQINMDAAKRNDEITKQSKAQQESTKTQIQNSESKRDNELQKVLTPEQFSKYTQLKTEKKQEAMQQKSDKKSKQSGNATPASKQN